LNEFELRFRFPLEFPRTKVLAGEEGEGVGDDEVGVGAET